MTLRRTLTEPPGLCGVGVTPPARVRGVDARRAGHLLLALVADQKWSFLLVCLVHAAWGGRGVAEAEGEGG